ncbi:histone acetyltransferase type B catalytic subunit [Fimicolochytrium jonesii]|uniref:histone acetyltransferase type B catalytic subunit n=1 Tax=Fimicolochytrium jonesii TaxID=1396493 RepID=UPI0022FF1C4D|nr:histone acetyltransferase type B catalytic subunit [Fimicolochytrium jonesii]KAI8823625.1 histone acetyltransferase type B catalytic subunit [Fimicolochytrium jonesii]
MTTMEDDRRPDQDEPLHKRRKLDSAAGVSFESQPVNSDSRDEGDEEGDEEKRELGPWETSSNEAVYLKFVNNDMLTGANRKDKWMTEREQQVFHPEFTYPIFGMEEVIYGYKDLKIDIHCSASTLYTYLSVTHNGTAEGLTTRKPDDVVSLLKQYLPPDVTEDLDYFNRRVRADEDCFVPLGEPIGEYLSTEERDVCYELYHVTFITPGFVDLHRRLQPFLLFYIEGASYIEETDERWQLVLLYERKSRDKAKPLYSLVGYMSYYPFFYYTPQALDHQRVRISQFVILPQFQRRGHGPKLYEKLYQYFLSQKHIVEITVEDPNEAFQRLRDKRDVIMMLRSRIDPSKYLYPAASKVNGNEHKESGAQKDAVKELARKLKLNKRQTHRCLEMLQFRTIEERGISTKEGKKALAAFRVAVKRRLFRQNEEALSSMERKKRLEALDETFDSVMEEYEAVLERLDPDEMPM